MSAVSVDEVIMEVKRQAEGFSRGTSGYRGVTKPRKGMDSKVAFVSYWHLPNAKDLR